MIASKCKGLWVGGPVPLGYRSIAKKLIVVEEEAEQVRTIFRRYLALGSIGLLIEDLHRCGVRPRARVGGDTGTINPTRFMVGPLAYLLKNRFYIGEVVYRGEVYPGEQRPIIDEELFEAVQVKLKDRAVTRKLRRSRSPSFLSGLLFDDRGNLMSPSHANKKGVRYRYYVSQAVLQKRKENAGTIARVAAPDIEELVTAALRHEVEDIDRQVLPVQTCPLLELSDRDLVAMQVERIVLRSRHIDITLRGSASPEGQGTADASSLVPSTLHLPWTRTNASARKGIAWKPSAQTNLDPAASEMLLIRHRPGARTISAKAGSVHSRRSREVRTRSRATPGTSPRSPSCRRAPSKPLPTAAHRPISPSPCSPARSRTAGLRRNISSASPDARACRAFYSIKRPVSGGFVVERVQAPPSSRPS